MSANNSPRTRRKSAYDTSYPGSGSKKKSKRKSLRTPVQNLPLISPAASINTNKVTKAKANVNSRRSASRSYLLVNSDDESTITPRTMIKQLLGTSVNSSATAEMIERKRSLPKNSDSNFKDFKVPTSTRRKSRKSLLADTPSDKATPRTMIHQFLSNAGEEDQTPISRFVNESGQSTSSMLIGTGNEMSAPQIPRISTSPDDGVTSYSTKSIQYSRRRRIVSPNQDGQNKNLHILGSDDEEDDGDSLRNQRARSKSRRSFNLHLSTESDRKEHEQAHGQSRSSVLTGTGNEMSALQISQILTSSDGEDSYSTKAIQYTKRRRIGSPNKDRQNTDLHIFGTDDEENGGGSPRKHKTRSKSGRSFNLHLSNESESYKDRHEGNSHRKSNGPSTSSLDLQTGMKSSKSKMSTSKMDVSIPQVSASIHVEDSSRNDSKRSRQSLHQNSDLESPRDVQKESLPLTKKGISRSSSRLESKSIRSSNRSAMRDSQDERSVTKSSSKRDVYDIDNDDSMGEPIKTPLLNSEKRFNRKHRLYASPLSQSQNDKGQSLQKSMDPTGQSIDSPSLLPKAKVPLSSSNASVSLTSPSVAINASPFTSHLNESQELSHLEPLSSTPRRNRSFFHSTKRQSTMESFLSSTTHVNKERQSMRDIRDVSPIRPFTEMPDDGNETSQALKYSKEQESTRNIQNLSPIHLVTEMSDRTQEHLKEARQPNTSHHDTASRSHTRQEENLATNDDSDYGQYSTLKTPHIDMDVRKEVSTLQRKPMKQVSSDKVNNPGMKQRAKPGNKPKSKRAQKKDTTLPRRTVKYFAQLAAGNMRISNEVLDEIEDVSEIFWKNAFDALETFALHAGRKTVTERDVVVWMKAQRLITSTSNLHDLIREHLPLELRSELIPM